MERALLWFKCAAVHDPVRPVIRAPAGIGWEGKQRRIDLVIERTFKGDELLGRMQGWFTADVSLVMEIICSHGRLKILDETHLVVETQNLGDMQQLSAKLAATFKEEVWLEIMEKKTLS